MRYLGQQRRSASIAYGALAIATVAQLAVPQLVQNMIDAVTRGSVASTILANVPPPLQGAAAQRAGSTLDQLLADQTNAERLLINAALIIVAFAVVRGIFSFVQAFMAEKTSQGVAFDIRNAIFARMQRLSFSYYDKNQTGQVMIRATDDVEKVRLFIAQGLMLAVQALLLLVGALAILAWTNWKLTLVVLPLLPLALVLFMTFGRLSQPLFGVVQRKLSTLNTILQENLAGIKVVKAFTRETYEEQRFDTAASDLMAQQLRVSRVFAFLFPLIFLLAQIGQAAILYYGGAQILGGTLDLGEYQKFSLYLVYVFFPLGQLGFIISLMAQAAASAGRIFEILDAEIEIADKPDALVLPQIEGRVEFSHVTFRYFGSSEPVLHDVSFVAEPGQTIALLGATGSGKSTIINLIPRFYERSEGAVLVDGHDVRDVQLDSLRSQIGIVLQETNLFSGTIRDNIAFGRSDATPEQVTAAARAAAAHDFIMTFPEGYDTPVGERGTTLSGGQRQRIAIARALLLEPRLLILDDSTSSVDLQTEYRIQQALDNLMKGRTSFVIAQRISTVLNADQILVLERGEIVARGKHEDLMEDSPIYAEIYTSQLQDDVEVASRARPAPQEA
ncbi:MAG: Heterodimeric efflux ABC transporter, permease/ATP-binding subunit 1 [uncultured Chloroflexia bacterium]|uniref:Heterodimeric efflux ABC transporter, permease/ATP-binding subunit 1 n=1 Tax=uncultured Chloroflexia bacterium TaxID=1672391 RepID=A0A6J4ICB3_9CHLR|nr:MAG: Heterodimeric efflux ABC transporter, permease/ATP-binding subunit 1 [uncultured Chloroflexia bacterium]